jgi:hypothetical protein
MDISYCDKCGKQIAGYDNEYGQVMKITLKIESDCNEIVTGKTCFCSPKCTIEYLKIYDNEERDILDNWKKGKILGVAPEMPKKKRRGR